MLAVDFVAGSLPLWAQRQPQATAICWQGQAISWQQLQARVSSLTAEFAALAAKPRLVINSPCPLSSLLAFLAVQPLAGLAMMFDPSWPDALKEQLLAHLSWDHQFSQRLSLQEPLAPLSPRPTVRPPEPTDDFYVGFTSGSTGLPKGYRRPHASWLASFAFSQQWMPVQPGDRVMAPGSLATSLHLYGLVHALQQGGTLVLWPSFRPKTLWQSLAEQRVTHLYATPTQVQLLLAQPSRQPPQLPELRYLLVSGAKWPVGLRALVQERMPRAEVIEFYGTSEMSFVCAHRSSKPAPEGSVGKAVPGVEIRIGQQPDQPVPVGQTGRIWVRSPLLFSGYEAVSEQSCWWQDWLTVGDHGFLDAEGHLFLQGREQRMLVSSGYNLYPEQIEQQVLAEPAIAQALVLGLPDPLRGQSIHLLLQWQQSLTKAEQRQQWQQLRQGLQLVLPSHQIPRHAYAVAHWPMTSSGKTQVPALAQALAAGELECLD